MTFAALVSHFGRRTLTATLLTTATMLAAPALASAQTVVSLTFDDGAADQYQALTMLQSRGMSGTFYIITGRVGSSGYMTWNQIRDLANAGNDISGHTTDHLDLTTLSTSQATAEVCQDRSTLIGQGFNPTSLAYPFGSYNSTVEGIVKSCGYAAARTIGGIATPTSCSSCPYAEPIPPPDLYALRTPGSVRTTTTLSELEGYVTQAEQHGGGWLLLAIHHICNGCDPTYATTPALLGSFLDWLKTQADTGAVSVRTVNEQLNSPPPPPPPPPPPGGLNLVANPSFETLDALTGNPACYQLGHYGTNTAVMTRSTDAHAGGYAEQLTITGYVSGDAKIVTKQDPVGTCAPALSAGTAYQLSTWYKSNAPALFIVYRRSSTGAWSYWTQSQVFPASSTWTQATFTPPALPSGYDGLSFGFGMTQNGVLTVDDYAMNGPGTGPDTTAPTVTLSSPADQAAVRGTVTMSATASDNVAVDHVDFLVDGTVVATDTSPPYSASWASGAAPDGQHTIAASATDSSLNTAQDAHTVLIDNTAPTSTASSPATSTTTSFTVTYNAADSQGGSGLAEVDLYAKAPGQSSYSKAAADTSPGASGSFTYTASAGNGTYDFYTRATDTVGNVQAAPTSPQASTTVNVPLQSTTMAVAAPASGAVGSQIAASSITATLQGASSGATGTITVKVYGPQPSPPADCSTAGSIVGSAQVAGPGSYHPSAGYTPTAAGSYWWYASYGGDSANAPSASGCGAAMAQTTVGTAPSAPLGASSVATRVVTTQGSTSATTSSSFTVSPNTTYVLFVFRHSQSGDTVGSIQSNNPALSGQAFTALSAQSYNTVDYQWVYYLSTGASASGSATVTVNFSKALSSGQITVLDLVKLTGNNLTAPILTANIGTATGATSSATVRLPGAPANGDGALLFFSSQQNGLTPVPSPAMSRLWYASQTPGAAAFYFAAAASQSESFTVGSGRTWGTILLEVKHA